MKILEAYARHVEHILCSSITPTIRKLNSTFACSFSALTRNEMYITWLHVIRYNFVQVLEIARRADHPFAGARILLLDRPGNIQSVYQPYKMITDSYYDVFASLPPLLPEGPLGILGLGAGTAARIIHHFWPHIDMHGWELDPAVVMVARRFFNLSELEVGSKVLGDRESVFGPIDGSVICEEDEDSHSAAVEAVEEDESTIPGTINST